MPSKLRQLIIKLTTGIESPEKLSQAFTVAATALASGGGFRPSWQHLRFEVLLAWALRAPAADKPTYPLKPFTLGPGFLKHARRAARYPAQQGGRRRRRGRHGAGGAVSPASASRAARWD